MNTSSVNELKMSKERFFKVLERMLEKHTVMLNNKEIFDIKTINELYGSLEKYTLSTYDDFYEMLQQD